MSKIYILTIEFGDSEDSQNEIVYASANLETVVMQKALLDEKYRDLEKRSNEYWSIVNQADVDSIQMAQLLAELFFDDCSPFFGDDYWKTEIIEIGLDGTSPMGRYCG